MVRKFLVRSILISSEIFIYLPIKCTCSSTVDKQSGWLVAKYFLSTYAAPRDPSTAIALVQQGSEPLSFIGLFDDWNSKLWKVIFWLVFFFVLFLIHFTSIGA